MKYERKIPIDLDCGVTIYQIMVGGKWKPYLINCMNRGLRRPSEFLRVIPGIGLVPSCLTQSNRIILHNTLLPGHKKTGVAKSLRHSGIGFVFIKNSGISAISYDSMLFHIYSFIITSNSGNFFNIYIKALTILEQAKPSPYGFTALLIAL